MLLKILGLVLAALFLAPLLIGALMKVDLGDEARIGPCDEALARWRSVAHGGQASIVYDKAGRRAGG